MGIGECSRSVYTFYDVYWESELVEGLLLELETLEDNLTREQRDVELVRVQIVNVRSKEPVEHLEQDIETKPASVKLL